MGSLTVGPAPTEQAARSRSKGERVAALLRSARGLPGRIAHAGRVALDILCWAATFQLVSRLRRRRFARVIRRSGLFDERFYLSQCGDDPEARRDPLEHYLVSGAPRGLDPNPLFETRRYLAENPSAAGPRSNPLVHFIRAGGGAARAAPPERPADPSPAPISPGEALLLGHPFRAPAPDAGGDEPCRVLVVARCPSSGPADPRVARTLSLVRLLREVGCAVVLLADGEGASGDLEDDLGRLGVDVRRGFSAGIGHLAVEGHRYRWALLSGPEPAYRYLPAVRAYCTQAKVIYDVGHSARPLTDGGAAGRAGEAALAERMVRADAACSDVVLVATRADREALLAGGCRARTEVLSDLGAKAGPEGARRLLESLVLGRREGGRAGASGEEVLGAWTA